MKEKKKAEMVVWKIPEIPAEKNLAKQTAPLLAQANSLIIKSDDHFIASWSVVQQLDTAIGTVEAAFDPLVKGLHKLHKMAIKMRDSFVEPLYVAKQRLMDLRQEYREEQEEIKRKADAAAAEAIRKAQQKELERAAKTAERQGQPEVAIALREEKASVPLTFFNPTPAVPKQEGSVLRERWVFEIIDAAAVEREYCTPDPKLIRPVVERLGPAAKISGIKITLDKSESSRTVA